MFYLFYFCRITHCQKSLYCSKDLSW